MLSWISKFHKPFYASYLLSLFYAIKRLLLWLSWSSFDFDTCAIIVARVVGRWRIFDTVFVQTSHFHFLCIYDRGVWLRHCCYGYMSKVERNLLVHRSWTVPTCRLHPSRTMSRAYVRWMSLRHWHKGVSGLIATLINGVRVGRMITVSSNGILALKSDSRCAWFISNWRLQLPVVFTDFILVEDRERIHSFLTLICIFTAKASTSLVLQAAQIEIFRDFTLFLTLGSLLSFRLSTPLLFFDLLAFLENLMKFGLSLAIHLFSKHAQGLDHVFKLQKNWTFYIGKFFIREVYVEAEVYSFLFFLLASELRSLGWVCMIH